VINQVKKDPRVLNKLFTFHILGKEAYTITYPEGSTKEEQEEILNERTIEMATNILKTRKSNFTYRTIK
jgi:quinol-cytochrome oxidoreductase complex cytochrome b subunit